MFLIILYYDSSTALRTCRETSCEARKRIHESLVTGKNSMETEAFWTWTPKCCIVWVVGTNDRCLCDISLRANRNWVAWFFSYVKIDLLNINLTVFLSLFTYSINWFMKNLKKWLLVKLWAFFKDKTFIVEQI